MPFELRIAIRYLVARRKQAFISVITFISMLGVTVGVMALMIALGLMTGLQREIRSKILGTTAHLHVFHGGAAAVEDYRDVVREVRDIPEVVGSAPTVYTKALISSTSASAFATVKGVHPEFERSVTDLGDQVEMGELEALARTAPTGCRRSCSGAAWLGSSRSAPATSCGSRRRAGASRRWGCCPVSHGCASREW